MMKDIVLTGRIAKFIDFRHVNVHESFLTPHQVAISCHCIGLCEARTYKKYEQFLKTQILVT